MSITNHALAALALTETGMPIVALAPRALVSHFILDALPHWGGSRITNILQGGRSFIFLAAADSIPAFIVFLLYVVKHPERAAATFIACFFAGVPDVYHNLHKIGIRVKPARWFVAFHDRM